MDRIGARSSSARSYSEPQFSALDRQEYFARWFDHDLAIAIVRLLESAQDEWSTRIRSTIRKHKVIAPR